MKKNLPPPLDELEAAAYRAVDAAEAALKAAPDDTAMVRAAAHANAAAAHAAEAGFYALGAEGAAREDGGTDAEIHGTFAAALFAYAALSAAHAGQRIHASLEAAIAGRPPIEVARLRRLSNAAKETADAAQALAAKYAPGTARE